MFQYFSNQNNFDFGSFNLLCSTASGHPAGLDLTAEMPIVEFCVCASCCGPQKELVVDTGSWSGPNIDGGASPFSGILPDGETDIFFTTIPDDIPADSSTMAVLPIGGNVSESLEAIGDRDWFRVDLVAGTSYIFTMDGSGTSPLDDPLLYLLTSDGSVLAFNDDGGPGLNSEIHYTAATSGTFFISAQSYNDNHAGDYRLTASTYTPVPLPMRTPQEIAEYLMNQDNEGVGPVWGSTNISFNIESISAGAQNLAQLAFDAWASVSGLTFKRTTGGADITFQNTDNGAYAQTSTAGDTITRSIINISSGWEGGNTDFDSYTYQTYVHEIGHALGLSHGGPYNGSASWSQDDTGDNIYQNDSWAYTVMSYFDQNEAGGFGSIRYVLGPQISDIIAISTMYGANSTTRNGDTVYGFHSTETDVHDFTQFTAPPSLSIFDTGGTDLLDFSGYTQDQTISLVQETFSSVGGYTNVISIASGTVIENAFGGSGNDIITGNDQTNILRGNAGHDTLNGGDGEDYLNGGAGDDQLYGGGGGGADIYAFDAAHGADHVSGFDQGSDKIRFEAGSGVTSFSDLTITQSGSDVDIVTSAGTIKASYQTASDFTADDFEFVVYGTSLGDTITGSAGNDFLYGRDGNDTLNGGAGDDQLYGGDDDDTLNGGDDDDTLNGGDGEDTLNGGDDDDTLDGGDGNDQLYGGDGRDHLYGGDGADILNGGDGIDRVIYNSTMTAVMVNLATGGTAGEAAGDTYISIEKVFGTSLGDTITGSADNDFLYGRDGNDTLNGGGGNDYLNGGDSRDLLYGGAGNDTLNGDDGDDYMYGSVDADRFDGGDGNDRVIYKYSPGGVIVHLGTGGTGGEAEGDTFVNVERIYGSEFDDQITGTTANEFLLGLKGNDTLNGGGGIDRLFGGDGDDTLNGGADEDHLLGQNDNDTLYGGDSKDLLLGGAGDDYLFGEDGDDYFYGDEGADRLNGGDGIDRVIYNSTMTAVMVNLATGGTAGDAAGDTYISMERVYGTSLGDTITGSAGNEFLYGRGGDDTLNGGAGDDQLYGGIGGADIYAFDAAHGTDYVFQFDQGSDKIRFEAGSGVTSFSDLTITQSGSDVDIVTSAGTIKAVNQTASDFTADDFEFVTAAAAEIADKTDGASMHAFAEDLTSKDQFAGLENLEGVTDEPSHGNMNARGEELELALAGQNATYENLSATTNTNPAQPDFVQLASELAADQGFDLEHWGREDHFIDSWLL